MIPSEAITGVIDTPMVLSWGGVTNWGWPRWAKLIWGTADWRLVVPAGNAATGGELSSDKEEDDESWDVFNDVGCKCTFGEVQSELPAN